MIQDSILPIDGSLSEKNENICTINNRFSEGKNKIAQYKEKKNKKPVNVSQLVELGDLFAQSEALVYHHY